MRILQIALRQRLRDWPTSLAFVTVLGSVLALAGAWPAIALPLRHLPFPQPDQLLAIETLKKGQAGGLTWADLEDLRTGSVQRIAGFSSRTWGLQTEAHGHIEVVLSQQVTGEFFAALGVMPYLGEPLTGRREQSGNQQWVWFTHASWRRLLGGARDLAGKVVWIDAVPYRVGGVLPPSFDFPHRGQSADVYLPLNRTEYFGARGPGGLGVIARLQPGVSPSQFDAELQARSEGLAAQFPGSNAGVAFVARDLASALLGDRWRLLQWLLAAVATLLLVAHGQCQRHLARAVAPPAAASGHSTDARRLGGPPRPPSVPPRCAWLAPPCNWASGP